MRLPDQAKAALLKLVSTLGYSAFPIVLASTQKAGYFAAAWRFGSAIAFSLYLAAAHSKLTFSRQSWNVIIPRLASVNVLLVLISRFDTVLFILATHHVSVATATIIAESSTITFIANMAWLHRKRARYATISVADLIPAILAFAGFIIASASETGSIPVPTDTAAVNTLVGIALALACAITSAGAANAFPWAYNIAINLDHTQPKDSTTLFATTILAAVTDFIAATITLMLMLRGTPSAYDLIPLAAGAVAFGTAGITSRKANIITRHFAVNLIGFARPLLVLPALVLTTGLQVANPYLLTAGAALIISSNLYVNVRHSMSSTNRGYSTKRSQGKRPT